MPSKIEVTIDEKPVPRQSLRMYTNKAGRAVVFDPQSKELMKYRAVIASQIPPKFRPWDENVEVYVAIDCQFPVPKSWPIREREEALAGRTPHLDTPDCDNMGKIYMDCIKCIIFSDDRQVTSLVITKRYAEVPCVTITCVGLNVDG